MMDDSKRVLEQGEILSFVLTAGVMLFSSFFYPAAYWLFILLTFIDGIATAFSNDMVISIDRATYVLTVLILGGITLQLSIFPIILETVAVVALMDLLFLIRRTRARSSKDFLQIILHRLESYVFTLLPAAIFSAGLIYLGGFVLGATIGPGNAILGLGLASIVVFLIILYATIRPVENLKSNS
jgi:hypothetical protein